MVSKLPTSRLVSEQELVVWLGEGMGRMASVNAFFFFFLPAAFAQQPFELQMST